MRKSILAIKPMPKNKTRKRTIEIINTGILIKSPRIIVTYSLRNRVNLVNIVKVQGNAAVTGTGKRGTVLSANLRSPSGLSNTLKLFLFLYKIKFSFL